MISVQQFVNLNEKKILFYSTPFVTGKNGDFPVTLQKNGSDTLYFPAFTSSAALTAYLNAIGCTEHLIIKGDLKSVLASLDSHPLLCEWGLVVDPQSPLAVEIPPQIRVQPKCLR
ncbi:MAG: hypothetical protein E7553_04345 [Ruminococcaceae bacterium]|nr:hypothetical protein [Oscillospiraceae bacterium]